MVLDLDRELRGILGAGAEFTLEEVETLLTSSTERASNDIETTFGSTGWCGQDAEPYEPPLASFDGPRPMQPQSNSRIS